MKKNIFDTEIEMIDLNTEDMEISYDGMSEPNKELGRDIQTMMKETQVFSAEEVEERLEEVAASDEQALAGATRVISVPESAIEKESVVTEEDILKREFEAGSREAHITSDTSDSTEDTDADYEEADNSIEDNDNENNTENAESDDLEFDMDVPKEKDVFVPRVHKAKANNKANANSHSHKANAVNKKPVPKGDQASKQSPAQASKGKKKKGLAGLIGGMGAVEYGALIGGFVILALLVAIGFKVLDNTAKKQKIQQFASVGALLSDMDGIGKNGITAMAQTARIDSVDKEDSGEEKVDKEDEPEEILGSASVNFVSIEKDLKIKFSDKKTSKLITGVKFEVNAKGPKGDKFTWTDTDMDGVIYVENLKPGNYEVTIVSIDKYQFPETATIVKVQDTVVYQAINVLDEAVDMSKVNLALEDNQINEADTGTVLQDTVEYVAPSSKTEKVYKKITDTTKITVAAFNYGAFRKVADVTLKIGETSSYSAQSTTSEGETLKYSSSNESVATVDQNGLITAKSVGTVTITQVVIKSDSSEKEGTKKTIEIEVKADVIAATGITVSNTSISVVKDATANLTATVTPETATDKTVAWSTADASIATVDSNGVVKGVKEGTTKITATANGGTNVKAEVSVTVTAATVAVTKVSITESSNVAKGETKQFKAKVEPDNATNKTVTWKSADTKIATVDAEGKVTGVAAGKVKITATCDGKEASVEITVSDGTKNLVFTDNNGKKYDVYIKNGNDYVKATEADKNKELYFLVEETKYTGWQTINGKVYYFDKSNKMITGEQVIQGAKYNFASDGSLSMGGGSRGIDVSAYQGNIDWNQVKNSGISFVIIRCGFRGYTQGGLILDSKYESYIKGATGAGLKVGIYFFSQAKTESEAVEEASLCVSLAKGYKISYPIFIDSEYSNGRHDGRADGLTKAQRTAVCKAFCETIKSSGYTPGIYASKSWFYNQLDVNSLNQYKIWMAHYCSQTDYKYKYDLWQHSSKGSVPGIGGNVDLDNSYLGY